MILGPREATCARLRVAARIVQLGYHDSGFEAEVKPRPEGEAVRISTPHCLQGDRTIWNSEPISGDWFTERVGRVIDSDAEFRAEGLQASGAALQRSRRHLGCFHRRTRGMADYLFGILVQIRVTLDQGSYALASGAFVPDLLSTWFAWAGREMQQHEANRVYAILDRSGGPVLLASTGGTLATREATLDLSALRWSMADDADATATILELLPER